MALIDSIKTAQTEGKLLASSVENLTAWLEGGFLPEWAEASIRELVESEAWSELDDRFYQQMAFGTGGLRGRTIGATITAAESGGKAKGETPTHPAIGTNVLNDFNVVRATLGLYRYTAAYLKSIGSYDTPRIVIAHDVRHFSRHFCELTASVWSKCGGKAFIFDGPRSTPQLSFTVRHLGTHAGVVVTASHNPPTDNGYKVYFEDGAQIVSPHAEGIIAEVNQVSLSEVPAFLDIQLETVSTLGEREEEAYQQCLLELVLDEEVIRQSPPKIVFTPIHGTGAIATEPLLAKLGIPLVKVDEQWIQDPAFPTVKSPNPENAEALTLGMQKAIETGADLVLATDPDGDRMGVAVRRRDGELVLLTGNQIGALLAEYRISALKDAEIIPAEGSENVALIKTFVTSPMQEAIASGHGIKTINTLTGFKWIGEKIRHYEEIMKSELYEAEGLAVDYDSTSVWTRAELNIDYSTFVVFGGEESYGYMASDRVRDKDAHAAVLMICELAAFLKSQDMTIDEHLDNLYYDYGYFEEKTINIYYEGAAGSKKIRNILDSYRENPPQMLGGVAVRQFTDFGKDDIRDADGKRIPPQDFFFLELENGYSFAVRGSGTEPKIKFYLFGSEAVGEDDELDDVKAKTGDSIRRLAESIDADARARAEDGGE